MIALQSGTWLTVSYCVSLHNRSGRITWFSMVPRNTVGWDSVRWIKVDWITDWLSSVYPVKCCEPNVRQADWEKHLEISCKMPSIINDCSNEETAAQLWVTKSLGKFDFIGLQIRKTFKLIWESVGKRIEKYGCSLKKLPFCLKALCDFYNKLATFIQTQVEFFILKDFKVVHLSLAIHHQSRLAQNYFNTRWHRSTGMERLDIRRKINVIKFNNWNEWFFSS